MCGMHFVSDSAPAPLELWYQTYGVNGWTLSDDDILRNMEYDLSCIFRLIYVISAELFPDVFPVYIYLCSDSGWRSRVLCCVDSYYAAGCKGNRSYGAE